MSPAWSFQLGKLGGALAVAAAASLIAVPSLASAARIDGRFLERSQLVQVVSEGGSAPGSYWPSAGGRLRCPSGKRALTGGAQWFVPGGGPEPGRPSIKLAGSAPVANGKAWYAEGTDFNAEPGDLATYVRCVRRKRLRAARVVERTYRPFYDGFIQGRARCRRGMRLTSGGAYFHAKGERPRPGQAELSTLSASLPLPKGKGWYAEGLSRIERPRLTVVATCFPKRMLARTRVTKRSVAIPTQSTAGHGGAVECPGRTRSLIGGAHLHEPGQPVDEDIHAGLGRLGGSAIGSDVRGWYATGARSAIGAVPALNLTTVLRCVR